MKNEGRIIQAKDHRKRQILALDEAAFPSTKWMVVFITVFEEASHFGFFQPRNAWFFEQLEVDLNKIHLAYIYSKVQSVFNFLQPKIYPFDPSIQDQITNAFSHVFEKFEGSSP